MRSSIVKFSIVCTLFTCIHFYVFGQLVVQGTVLDATSRLPIQNASIYFNNTQIGMKTNDAGKFRVYADQNYPELIVSAVGYEKSTIEAPKNANRYTVLLKPVSNVLKEVHIYSYKASWERWGTLFLKSLLGKDSHDTFPCKILNPEDVVFYFDQSENVLEVDVKKPLIIQNGSLAYLMYIDLNEFKYYFDTNEFSYLSSVRYEAYNPRNYEAEYIHSIRRHSYYGSKIHFLKSLYQNTLAEEGFKLYRYKSVQNIERQRVAQIVNKRIMKNMAAGKKEEKLSDNRDTAAYYNRILAQKQVLSYDTILVDPQSLAIYDEDNKLMHLKFSDTLMLVYTRDLNMIKNTSMYSANNGRFRTLETLLFLKELKDEVVDAKGNTYNSTLYMYGHLGNKGLANLLPIDFDPKSLYELK